LRPLRPRALAYFDLRFALASGRSRVSAAIRRSRTQAIVSGTRISWRSCGKPRARH